MRLFSDNFRWQKHLELRGDKESIKRMLLTRTSCSQSLPCTPGQISTLFESNGSVLISGNPLNPTYFGPFAIRAECNANGSGFEVRVARLIRGRSLSSISTADFMAGPTVMDTNTFAEPRALLFPAGVEMCSDRRETIVCQKMNWIPPGPYPGPAPHPERGWYFISFTATECGGVLPTSEYLGSIAKSEICGDETSVMALQPTEAFATLPPFISNPVLLKTPLAWTGPGFSFVWLGGCANPPSASFIEVIYTRR